MSAFLLRFKANYLAKMHGYPHFSLWISIALAKIYFFRIVLTWRKNLCIQQVPSLSFQFLIPFIANYFCYFERAMAHQQAVYDSFWFIRKYSGQNLINEALQKFQRTKHCFDFELFTQPFSSQVLLLSSLIVGIHFTSFRILLSAIAWGQQMSTEKNQRTQIIIISGPFLVMGKIHSMIIYEQQLK